MSDVPPRRRGSGIVIASTLAMLLFLLSFFAILSPGFALAILALVGFCVLQYLVWGWWLSLLLPHRTDGVAGEVPPVRGDE